MVIEMIVTTTNDISGKRIVEYKGIVFGEVFYSPDAGWVKLTIIKNYEDALIKSKELALDKMKENALKIGANAIVGASFVFNYIGHSVSVSATGTAVVVE